MNIRPEQVAEGLGRLLWHFIGKKCACGKRTIRAQDPKLELTEDAQTRIGQCGEAGKCTSAVNVSAGVRCQVCRHVQKGESQIHLVGNIDDGDAERIRQEIRRVNAPDKAADCVDKKAEVPDYWNPGTVRRQADSP